MKRTHMKNKKDKSTDNKKEKPSKSRKVVEIILIVLPLIGFILGAAIVISQENTNIATCINQIQEETITKWEKGKVSEDELKIILEDFDKLNETNSVEFKKDERIPKNTLLKINFGLNTNTEWKNYPVKPIVYFNNYGLFRVVAEFPAPTSGICMTINSK